MRFWPRRSKINRSERACFNRFHGSCTCRRSSRRRPGFPLRAGYRGNIIRSSIAPYNRRYRSAFEHTDWPSPCCRRIKTHKNGSMSGASAEATLTPNGGSPRNVAYAKQTRGFDAGLVQYCGSLGPAKRNRRVLVATLSWSLRVRHRCAGHSVDPDIAPRFLIPISTITPLDPRTRASPDAVQPVCDTAHRPRLSLASAIR